MTSGTPAVVRLGTSLSSEPGLAQEPENHESEHGDHTRQGMDRPSTCAHGMPHAAMRARTTTSASTVMGENSQCRTSDSQGVDKVMDYDQGPDDPTQLHRFPSDEQPGDQPPIHAQDPPLLDRACPAMCPSCTNVDQTGRYTVVADVSLPQENSSVSRPVSSAVERDRSEEMGATCTPLCSSTPVPEPSGPQAPSEALPYTVVCVAAKDVLNELTPPLVSSDPISGVPTGDSRTQCPVTFTQLCLSADASSP